MARFGGADEVVIGDIHLPPQVSKPIHDFGGIFQRSDAQTFGGTLNFLTMFIRAGQKTHLIAVAAFKTCNGIGNRGTVGVTDMQLCTGVINRGCNVIGFLLSRVCHLDFSSSTQSLLYGIIDIASRYA